MTTRTTPERYQRVPLDARFGESDAMKQVLAAYQDQLKESGFAGLGLVPERGPPEHPKGQQFVGSAGLRRVSYEGLRGLEETPHAHGTETLLNFRRSGTSIPSV